MQLNRTFRTGFLRCRRRSNTASIPCLFYYSITRLYQYNLFARLYPVVSVLPPDSSKPSQRATAMPRVNAELLMKAYDIRSLKLFDLRLATYPRSLTRWRRSWFTTMWRTAAYQNYYLKGFSACWGSYFYGRRSIPRYNFIQLSSWRQGIGLSHHH